MNCKPPSFKGSEEAVELTRWFKNLESIFRICNCADVNRVKYATHMLSGLALTMWNGYAQTVGLDAANTIPWPVLKRMMTDKFCPPNQIQKLEVEFWELKVKRTDIEAYTNRFIELVTLCPDMVPTEHKKIERYIICLPEEIKGNIIAANKVTLDAVILMAQNLMMAKRRKAAANKQAEAKTNECKRKFEPAQGSTQGSNKKVADNSKGGYSGKQPFFPPSDTPATKANAIVPTCYDCGEKGHFRNQCQKKKGNTGNANAKS
ncbi:uncharacterized protein [Rutidosis leptorrhynchoides]|uniref:uncharacterized protein n=1 Tax=Rutidosis leptorrhynchoides TaxID=125765 RepID=UPI003A99CC03